MAKARKVAKAKKTKRGTKAKTKSKTKTKSKRLPARKSRSKNEGIADKMASAVRVVADTVKETSEMRNKMGSRGGLDEG